jgi:hypothetical protein
MKKSFESTWKPLLPNNQIIENKLHELARITTENYSILDSAGLMSGLSGVAIFLAEYGSHFKINNGQLVANIMEQAFENVQNIWHPPSFCSGLSGLLWAAHYIKETIYIDIDFDFSEIEDFLFEQELLYARKNNFDFLHGANGIFYYYLSLGSKIDIDHVNSYLELLNSFSKADGKGGITWESIVDTDNPILVNNLSLSHGIASTIIILSNILRKYPKNETAFDMLEKSVQFLIRSKNIDTQQSIFPPYTSLENGLTRKSRLGWCYGDLGIGISLIVAGSILRSQQATNEGIDTLLHSSLRRDLSANSVVDAGICHGAGGIAHIFNRLFHKTGIYQFKDASLYWYEVTIGMANKGDDSFGGYQMFGGDSGWKNELNFLEGISGVGLTLISALRETEPKWDSCILINLEDLIL